MQAVSSELRRQRALFQEAGSSSAILSVHQLMLRTTDHSKGQASTHTFLVGQSNGSGAGREMAAFAAEAAQALGAPLVPWGAVAAPLTSTGKSGTCLEVSILSCHRCMPCNVCNAGFSDFSHEQQPVSAAAPSRRRSRGGARVLLPPAAREDRAPSGARQRPLRALQVLPSQEISMLAAHIFICSHTF